MDATPHQRRKQLCAALELVGVPLRDDSNLARAYIAGTTVGPMQKLSAVVDTLCLQHWLYNYTDYGRVVSLHTEAARRIYRHHFRNTIELEAFILGHIIPTLRMHCIQTNGGVPAVWPWL
jgi:hypothetical protein